MDGKDFIKATECYLLAQCIHAHSNWDAYPIVNAEWHTITGYRSVIARAAMEEIAKLIPIEECEAALIALMSINALSMKNGTAFKSTLMSLPALFGSAQGRAITTKQQNCLY